MATRKMTFSLPGDLAQKFVKRVPARERSHFLSVALEKRLMEEEKSLIRACKSANEDPDLKALEKEWDQINDEIEEPWSDSSSR